MSMSVDLPAALEVWDLTGDLANYAEAWGSMFAEVESYVLEQDVVLATLNGTLHPGGGAITVLPLTPNTPIPSQISNNRQITLTDPTGVQSQDWITTAYMQAGGIQVSVESDTPNYAYPPGSTITVHAASWQALFDVDICPFGALPWLAQVVGERLPQLTDPSQDGLARFQITTNPNQYRGTPVAIADAVKRCLTGTQLVAMWERHRLDGTPDDDALAIFTYTFQTPSENAVLDALRRTVPADIFIDYEITETAIWSAVEFGMTDWTDLEATYGPTWETVAASFPGFVIY